MKKFIATIRIRGRSVKTLVHADSALEAKLLLQYHFGDNGIATGPVATDASSSECRLLEDLLLDLLEAQSTAEQQRLDSLKAAKERAADALAAERRRIRILKAQRALDSAKRFERPPAS